MDKFIDLNERKSNVAIIKLRDKRFRIVRIVAGVRVSYSNYLKQVSDFFKELSEASDSNDSKWQEELTQKYDNFANTVPEALRSIIELLLKTNDLPYEDNWWKDEVDVQDMRDFIDAALSKDYKESIKKKLIK